MRLTTSLLLASSTLTFGAVVPKGCTTTYPASVDSIQRCIDGLKHQASDTWHLSGPPGVPNVAYKPVWMEGANTVLIGLHREGDFQVNDGHIACGLQRLLDECDGPGGKIGGFGSVCRTEDVYIYVSAV